MKSFSMCEYFICTDWHHNIEKWQYSYYLEQQSLLCSPTQTRHRLKESECLNVPPECAKKCTEESDEFQVSSVPP